MTLALDATSRISVGSSVLNPVSLHPAELAGITAALQDFSGGRFILGLGAGSEVFLPWAGIRPERPLERTRRGIRAVRALLEGGSPADVPGVGEGWHPAAKLKDGPCAPTPIYVGAMGPKLLQLAGREADGVIALCLPPSRFHWVQEQVDKGAEGTRTIDLACGLWVAVDEDRDVARRLLAGRIAAYGGALSKDALAGAGYDVEQFDRIQALVTAGDLEGATALVDDRMLELGIAGDVVDVTDRCLDLIEQGARHISFGSALGVDPMEAIRLIGDKVLPVLRGTE
jgi:5,10-methylenetetrahydromethanopterin reductase